MQEILKTPSSKRNSDWEESFLKAFPGSKIYLRSDEPFLGPDGFSYMDVTSEPSGPLIKLDDFLSWCAHAGVGLVLNLKSNKTPDYVFNYGMIWNYVLRAKFLNPGLESPEEIKENQTFFVHKILEGYLPQYVRENIKDFLALNKISDAKLTLISKGDNTPYELLWYFSNDIDLSEADQKTLLESIAWFLPLDYKVAMASNEDPSLHLEPL